MKPAGRTLFVILAACLVAASLRVGAWLPNIAAVGALALYSGSRLKPWLAWIPALALMAATDLAIKYLYGWEGFVPSVYACYVIDALLGWAVIRRTTIARIGGAAFLSALQFYLITNFFVWWSSAHSPQPAYGDSVTGLLTCYVMGLPFFGYTLLGNVIFCTAFFGAEAMLANAGDSRRFEGSRHEARFFEASRTKG